MFSGDGVDGKRTQARADGGDAQEQAEREGPVVAAARRAHEVHTGCGAGLRLRGCGCIARRQFPTLSATVATVSSDSDSDSDSQ